MSERLTQKQIDELAGALHRLKELNSKAIKESTDASETRGLNAFLQSNLMNHAEEFIACWITVQNEYRPLLQGFSGLFANTLAVLQAREINKAKQCECAPGSEAECKAGCVCTTTEAK
jgi:flagellar biosynthesis component FlhA